MILQKAKRSEDANIIAEQFFKNKYHDRMLKWYKLF